MDEEKLVKLAAARKKLKKYQKKKVYLEPKTQSTTCSSTETGSRNSSPNFEADDSLRTSNSSSISPEPVEQCSSNLPINDNNINVNSSTTIPYQESVDEQQELSTIFINEDASTISSENVSVDTVIKLKPDEISSRVNGESTMKSTTESLRQLSYQMSGLINENDNADAPDERIRELERRNNELALLLSKEKEKSMQETQLKLELSERLQRQVSLTESLQKNCLEPNPSGPEVLSGLREQLQLHIQTIGILVAEKSDLQSRCSNLKHSLEQKTIESGELEGRLDAARTKVLELKQRQEEIELKQQQDDFEERLQRELEKYKKVIEEMKMGSNEMQERLTTKDNEIVKLKQSLNETKRQLEMAQLHLSQLRNNDQHDFRSELEQLKEFLQDSQRQLAESSKTVLEIQNEKTRLEMEYKNYTTQLKTQNQQLNDQLTKQVTKTKELEKKKQFLEVEMQKQAATNASEILSNELKIVKEEKLILTQQVNNLQEEKKLIESNFSTLDRDNYQLAQLVSEQASKLDSLESLNNRNSAQHVNTDQLLQKMQSDKIAAARALSQNKQLKEQLEELQSGFVLMSNKKLELAEKLEKELYAKKSLHKEISLLQEREQNLSRKIEGFQSVANTYKSFEDRRTPPRNDEESSLSTEGSHIKEEKTASELTTENAFECIEETNITSKDDEIAAEKCPNGASTDSSNVLPPKIIEEMKKNYDHLLEAHKCLESRFLKCMSQVANLSDEKQELEHVVQQLQLETETVGDYITIYQFQRGVMKQQMSELENELEMMRFQKQDMLTKFNRMQKLFNTLALEAGGITAINLMDNFKIIEGVSDKKKPSSTETKESLEDKKTLENGTGDENLNNGDIISSTSNQNGTEFDPSSISDPKQVSKSITVREIMNLINDMEGASQLDLTTLSKFNHCSHCSGKLKVV